MTIGFALYKSSAQTFEARIWHSRRSERIITLPAPKELLRAFTSREKNNRKTSKKRKKGGTLRHMRAVFAAMRLREVKIEGVLGTGDAAATALSVGALCGVLYSLLTPKMKKPPLILIAPDFDNPELRLELAGIADVCIGKSTLKLVRG